jgi:hypothetical protein
MMRGLRTAIATGCVTAALTGALTGSPAAAAEPGAYCEVTAGVVARWAAGYSVLLAVRNVSDVPVRWNVVRLRFTGPVLSAQVWNATYTQTGPEATVVPWPGSGLLTPGATATIGMINASGTVVTPPPPDVTCTPA